MLLQLIEAHPEWVAIFVLTILTAIFKPRSPEAYASMPPRLAALLQLGAAIFPDVRKATAIAPKLVSGQGDPAKEPLPTLTGDPTP